MHCTSVGITIHCSIANIKAVCLMVSEKIFKMFPIISLWELYVVIYSLPVFAPIVYGCGGSVGSLFYGVILDVLSSLPIILLIKRELDALL